MMNNEECLHCDGFATHYADIAGCTFYLCTNHATIAKLGRGISVRRYAPEQDYNITGSYASPHYGDTGSYQSDRNYLNIHNLQCKYCDSKITNEMIVCSRCGAPIHN
jgi:hypothetical protein